MTKKSKSKTSYTELRQIDAIICESKRGDETATEFLTRMTRELRAIPTMAQASAELSKRLFEAHRKNGGLIAENKQLRQEQQDVNARLAILEPKMQRAIEKAEALETGLAVDCKRLKDQLAHATRTSATFQSIAQTLLAALGRALEINVDPVE